MSLKCYYVTDVDRDEDGGVLVHAETPGKAKGYAIRHWDGFCDDSEFEDLRATRMPKLLIICKWRNLVVVLVIVTMPPED